MDMLFNIQEQGLEVYLVKAKIFSFWVLKSKFSGLKIGLIK